MKTPRRVITKKVVIPVNSRQFSQNRMKTSVPVSCLCLTYGRPQLLEEAIQSFLIQEYPGPKELIILNDLAEQQLVCDEPEVVVINLSRPFRSLGEKRNASAALAKFDVLCTWDDDDIYLPHRLSLSVRHLSRGKGFFKSANAFVLNDGALIGPEGNLFHGGSCYTRETFHAVRGYRALDVGEDLQFEYDLARCTAIDRCEPTLPASEEYYIYRSAGTNSYHISGFAGTTQRQSVAAFVHDQIKAGQVSTGTIELRPQWRRDYQQMVRDYLSERARLLLQS